jgi:hypothetical protein
MSLNSLVSPTTCLAAAAGSIVSVLPVSGFGWSALCSDLVTSLSAEFHDHVVVPSSTMVCSDWPFGRAARNLPLPSVQIRALCLPSASCGISAIDGRPSLLSTSTVPPNAPGLLVMTCSTSDSADTSGRDGGWPAPAGMASRLKPVAPVITPAAAAARVTFRLFISGPLLQGLVLTAWWWVAEMVLRLLRPAVMCPLQNAF